MSIADVFTGLVRIPNLDIRKSRYSISAAANLHLEGCKVKLAALRFENKFQMLKMLVKDLTEDKNIVNINQGNFPIQVAQNLSHHGLERNRCIHQTKRGGA